MLGRTWAQPLNVASPIGLILHLEERQVLPVVFVPFDFSVEDDHKVVLSLWGSSDHVLRAHVSGLSYFRSMVERDWRSSELEFILLVVCSETTTFTTVEELKAPR